MSSEGSRDVNVEGGCGTPPRHMFQSVFKWVQSVSKYKLFNATFTVELPNIFDLIITQDNALVN